MTIKLTTHSKNGKDIQFHTLFQDETLGVLGGVQGLVNEPSAEAEYDPDSKTMTITGFHDFNAVMAFDKSLVKKVVFVDCSFTDVHILRYKGPGFMQDAEDAREGFATRGGSWLPSLPPEGTEVVGYKALRGGMIAIIKVPKDAERCETWNGECRCSKAEITEITLPSIKNSWYRLGASIYPSCMPEPASVYTQGQIAYPDAYDGRWWVGCAPGIWFYLDRSKAEEKATEHNTWQSHPETEKSSD